jgi:putative methyltransferase (TIGR04325 family)
MRLKSLARRLLPPIAFDIRRYFLNRLSRKCEYVPEGWQTRDARIRGWNVESIPKRLQSMWPLFLRAMEHGAPLTVAHPLWNAKREGPGPSANDYAWHNTAMTYAYVLAQLDHLSLLDWGGGTGHYYILSKTLLPDVEFDYHCKELPLLCQYGRELLPEARFYKNEEECFQRSYDLVLASSSLQYSQDWKETVSRLASVSRSYLYVARLPIVRRAASFVVVQRMYSDGYETEFLSWFLNRDEFLNHMGTLQVELVREFLINEWFYAHKAPEHGECRGFLFRPTLKATTP